MVGDSLFSECKSSLCILCLVSLGFVYSSLGHDYHSRHFPNRGFHCPNASPGVYEPRHHCYLGCIGSSVCAAVNYNITNGKCSWMTKPCARASHDDDMEVTLFTRHDREECLNWIEVVKNHVLSPHDRVVYNDNNWLLVARMIHRSGYYPASWRGACYATNDTIILKMNKMSLPCEILLLDERCSAAWVNYSAGDPLPPNVVMTADGLQTYVVFFDPDGYARDQRIGYFTEEGGYGVVSHYGGIYRTAVMKMLVLL